MASKLKLLPTEFRGCLWDDGWEFDAPCVIYYPCKFRCFGIGGNVGHLENMVEDICIDLINGEEHSDGGLAHECEWRSWGQRFDRREHAWHVVFNVKWKLDADGEAYPDVQRVCEVYGASARVRWSLRAKRAANADARAKSKKARKGR